MECATCPLDELAIYRKGKHTVPYPLRGVAVPITFEVFSEDTLKEKVTVPAPEKVYGKRKNTVFLLELVDGVENLKCLNRGGLHTRTVNYFSREIFYKEPDEITPPERCR